MPWNPTCYDCLLAEIDPGEPGCHTLPNGDPGWPGSPACFVGCPYSDGDEDCEAEPKICEHFQPKMIERCQVCKAPINQPRHIWQGFASGGWEPVPVCSSKCATNHFLKESIYRWHDDILRWKMNTGQLEEYTLFYCPCCEIELQPFTEETSWWISDSTGTLYCFCHHCEQEVRPEDKLILLEHKISYAEAKKIAKSTWRKR